MPMNFDPRPLDKRPLPDDEDEVPDDEQRDWQPFVAYGGAALGAIGSLLPWAEVNTVFGSADLAGTDGDGVLTLFGSLIYAAAFYFARQRWHIWAALLVAFAVLGTAMYDAIHIREVATDVSTEFATASVGIGLWLVIVGGIAMFLAAMLRPLPAGSER
jgi:hypothetical protein